MEKITKNPGLNNFLLKYDKRDWDQIVLKLSLIALSYLKSLPETKIFYSLNDLDQVLYKLEDYNISQMGNKQIPKGKRNKKKEKLPQNYKPPIDNQLKGKKIPKEKLNYSSNDENVNNNNEILDKENEQYNTLLNDNINQPFLNTNMYNSSTSNYLNEWDKINDNCQNLIRCNPCCPCNDPCCCICKRIICQPICEKNLNFDYGDNINTGIAKNKIFNYDPCGGCY